MLRTVLEKEKKSPEIPWTKLNNVHKSVCIIFSQSQMH